MITPPRGPLPFAVIKPLAKQHPNMNLRNLAALANGKVNGTHRQAESGGKTTKTTGRNIVKTGVAIDLDPILQQAITNVTSVREASVDVVTAMVRGDCHNDSDVAVQHRKKGVTGAVGIVEWRRPIQAPLPWLFVVFQAQTPISDQQPLACFGLLHANFGPQKRGFKLQNRCQGLQGASGRKFIILSRPFPVCDVSQPRPCFCQALKSARSPGAMPGAPCPWASAFGATKTKE
jgi:hypothetical protein